MNLEKFFEMYYFHDSIIEKIEYVSNEKKLVISIELCNWKQSFYKNGEPEMRHGKLIFKGVTYFKIDPNSSAIENNDILNISFVEPENMVKVVFTYLDDIGIFIVKAGGVFWEWVNRYECNSRIMA